MNDDEIKPFYKVLRELERRKGLCEKELIFELEIPRTTYLSWKYGICEPSKRVYWRRLKLVFSTSWEFLMDGKDIKNSSIIP